MKTAKDYYREFLQSTGWSSLDYLSSSYIEGFEKAVAAIRADALAEKSVAPDADEERAKREFNAWRGTDSYVCDFEMQAEETRNRWRAYVKTLPPRPVRSPGQRLFESERSVNHWSPSEEFASLSELTRNLFETRATALGIKPQE